MAQLLDPSQESECPLLQSLPKLGECAEVPTYRLVDPEDNPHILDKDMLYARGDVIKCWKKLSSMQANSDRVLHVQGEF